MHVDPPAEHKAYLHRSGRTARAGNEGTVVTVMTSDQRKDTQALLKKAAISARPVAVTAASPVVVELVGEVAPYVEPEVVAPQPQQQRRSGGGHAPGRGRAGRGKGTGQRSDGAGRGQGGSAGQGGQQRRQGQGGQGGQQRSGARQAPSGQGRPQGQGRAQQPRRRATRPAG